MCRSDLKFFKVLSVLPGRNGTSELIEMMLVSFCRSQRDTSIAVESRDQKWVWPGHVAQIKVKRTSMRPLAKLLWPLVLSSAGSAW